MSALDPKNGEHRADIRDALERDITDIVRRERTDIPNPEGLAALITREITKRGWL